VRFEPYEKGSFGWGCFRMSSAPAERRTELSARTLATEREPGTRSP